MTELLSTMEMGQADRLAVVGGKSSLQLMESAGWQVARSIRQRYCPRTVVVLCGPGNNGGDGFVVARLLDGWGWPVRLALLGSLEQLQGDAAVMAGRWVGPVQDFEPSVLRGHPLVVDALFGAGLARPLEGVVKQMIEAVNERQLPVVSIDLPSGVNGNTGQVLGAAIKARLTVTFFRPKPGHLLLPGRDWCGEVIVADIGIPAEVLEIIRPQTRINGPDLWLPHWPRPASRSNKYDRGHLVVAGGQSMTGAACLAADAGRRIGAGLVTITAATEVLPIYRAHRPGTMVLSSSDWPLILADPRKNAAVLGPGLGVGAPTRALVLSALRANKLCVLDADALTSFAEHAKLLWRAGGQLVLTPHDGEFARLFSLAGDRLSRASQAAAESGAVILLKGADTVVAAPDGRAAIACNAPADLATAGSGDVLAGMVAGLLAQGMPRFEAAAMAVWVHGEVAAAFGCGLIAEDLVDGLPDLLRRLSSECSCEEPING